MGRSLYAALLLAIVISIIVAGLVFKQERSKSTGLKETLEPISLKNLIKAYLYVNGRKIADPPNLNVYWLLADLFGAGYPLRTIYGINISIGGYKDALIFIKTNSKLELRVGNGRVSTSPDETFSPGSQGVAPDQCSYSYTDDAANNQFVAVITCYFDTVYNATEIWLQKQTQQGTFLFFYTHLNTPILINKSYVTYKIYLKYVSNGVSLKGLMDILEYFITGEDPLNLEFSKIPNSDYIKAIGGYFSTSTSLIDGGRSWTYPCLTLYKSEIINKTAIFVTTGNAGGCKAGSYSAIDIIIHYVVSPYFQYHYYISLIKLFISVSYNGATDSYYLSLILRWG